MENIKQYVKALTNFYGMVHKEKLVEIYNHQNEDKIMPDYDHLIPAELCTYGC